MEPLVLVVHRNLLRLGSSGGSSLGPLVRTEESSGNPQEPHDGADDRVRSEGTAAGLGERESQPTIDDAERDGQPADPEMGVRPDSAAAEALEPKVMDHSQGGLEEEHCKDDQANNRVGVRLWDGKLFLASQLKLPIFYYSLLTEMACNLPDYAHSAGS